MPIPSTDEERAAIAFYREGISLDNPFYGFLSLFKVIGALLPNGKKREAWIADALDRLDDHRAKERREELRSQDTDVSAYLRDECRNAIAHAERNPYVNPDEVDDHFRLSKDLPLLRNLAELAIEENSSLKRSHTLWREHLYELAGFKELLSEEVIDKLTNSIPIPEGTIVEIPDLYTVAARHGAEVYSFENMRPEITGQVEGGMVLDLVSEDAAIRIRTVLSFADERLVFDPVHGVGFTPNRENKTYIRHELNVLHFSLCILSNGHLEIWDQEGEIMLGRSETCIPVNCFVNTEFYDSEFATLERLLDDGFAAT
ncbi:methylamine utilization protein MauJ [Nitrosomonas sp.]|uniref:methylamine utilization protein MauJ n=1 Tax=Nitrosomonas sp. TaxID=42353 RepID=UPI0025D06B74|nr:methylamine utilization protein MauJ [Nitrosomonas sp.]